MPPRSSATLLIIAAMLSLLSTCILSYCRKDAEEERFYEIFFQLCRKYSVRWASATPKEKSFIEEVTRVTYERDRAQRLGLPLSEVRPSFAS